MSRKGMLALLGLIASTGIACSSSQGVKTIEEFAAKLDQGGIPCKSLEIEDVEYGDPAPAIQPDAVGFCVLGDAPKVRGREMPSMMSVYEPDNMPPDWPPAPAAGHELVYGENWQFDIATPSIADDVQRILGGQVVEKNLAPGCEERIEDGAIITDCIDP